MLREWNPSVYKTKHVKESARIWYSWSIHLYNWYLSLIIISLNAGPQPERQPSSQQPSSRSPQWNRFRSSDPQCIGPRLTWAGPFLNSKIKVRQFPFKTYLMSRLYTGDKQHYHRHPVQWPGEQYLSCKFVPFLASSLVRKNVNNNLQGRQDCIMSGSNMTATDEHCALFKWMNGLSRMCNHVLVRITAYHALCWINADRQLKSSNCWLCKLCNE